MKLGFSRYINPVRTFRIAVAASDDFLALGRLADGEQEAAVL